MLSQLDTSGGIEPNFATQLTHWIALLEYSVPRVTQHALKAYRGGMSNILVC